MIRRMIIGSAFTALICIAVNIKVTDPADNTGAWYRASDGMESRIFGMWTTPVTEVEISKTATRK